ncbi:hypothetical protein IJ541_04740 [bacterium]|nr:hypothetical protein [bacterium]
MGITFNSDGSNLQKADSLSGQSSLKQFFERVKQKPVDVKMSPHMRTIEYNPDPYVAPKEILEITGKSKKDYKPSDENLIFRYQSCVKAKNDGVKINKKGYDNLVKELQKRGYDLSTIDLMLNMGMEPSAIAKKK